MLRDNQPVSIAPFFISSYNEWCTATFLLLDDIVIPPRCMLALEMINIFFTRPYKLPTAIKARLYELKDSLTAFLPLTTASNAARLQTLISLLIPEIFNEESDLYKTLVSVTKGRIRTLVCHYLMGEGYYMWSQPWSGLLRKVPLNKPSTISQEQLSLIWQCRGAACSSDSLDKVKKLFPAVKGDVKWDRTDIPWMYRKYFRELKADHIRLSET